MTSDSFAGLRALLVPFDRAHAAAGTRRRRTAAFGIEDAGRWSLVRARRQPTAAAMPATRRACRPHAAAPLRRCVLAAARARGAWLPPWRDLLRVYRRLEGRGEIRGGRFVAGFSGEQFALPEAIGTLREMRRQPPPTNGLAVSGADPLNLVGILTPGPRLPALTGNRLLYRDGVPIATLSRRRDPLRRAARCRRPSGSPARRWCAVRDAARPSAQSGPHCPTSRRPVPRHGTAVIRAQRGTFPASQRPLAYTRGDSRNSPFRLAFSPSISHTAGFAERARLPAVVVG